MSDTKFYSLAALRQSCRRYDKRPVESEKIKQIVESARIAPSASNSQPWTLVVADDPQKVTALAAASVSGGIPINKFAAQAPVFIVVVVEKARVITRLAGWIKEKDFAWTDLGIIAEHICLQATELDLGTCMIGWFDENKVRQILDIPSSKRVGLLITLGYPPEGYPLRKKIRKPHSDIVRYNSYK
jgi:nitroreductase